MQRSISFGALLGLLTSCATPTVVQPRAKSSDKVYIYYFDELVAAPAARAAGGRENPNVPDALARLRKVDDKIFLPCLPPPPGADPDAAIAPVLIPLALFGFNLFMRVLEADLAGRERRRLAALSKSYTQVRSDLEFPSLPRAEPPGTEPRPRCLVVDRVTETGGGLASGSIYVFGLKSIGDTAFTVEPLSARVDASPVLEGQSAQTVNSNVSLTFQSVQPNRLTERAELTTLPVFSVSFDDLKQGVPAGNQTAEKRSPVMPVSFAKSPTTVAVAITEAHTSLAKEKERAALEQANRAALVAALGETLKAALSD